MKLTHIVLTLLVGVLFTACSDNYRAQHLGGTLQVQVPAGNKVIGAGWKTSGDTSSLWYLYRPAHPGEQPEQVVFQEKSAVGLMQGQVVFNESL